MWRARGFVDYLSYEVSPDGAYLPHTSHLITIAAPLASEFSRGSQRAEAALRLARLL